MKRVGVRQRSKFFYGLAVSRATGKGTCFALPLKNFRLERTPVAWPPHPSKVFGRGGMGVWGEGGEGCLQKALSSLPPRPHPSSPKDFHAYRIPVRRFPGLSEAGLYCCALRQKRFPSPWRREPLEWQSNFFRVAGFPPCGFSTSWRKRGNGIRTVLWLSFWFLQPRCRVRPSLQARF